MRTKLLLPVHFFLSLKVFLEEEEEEAEEAEEEEEDEEEEEEEENESLLRRSPR